MKNTWLIIAHLGVGLLPGPTGTWGSAIGVILFWLLGAIWSPLVWVLLVAGIVLGLKASDEGCREWGPDPRQVIIDEVSGQTITLLFAPPEPLLLVIGFLAFRFFDIAKFWPMSALERLKGGLGVMADDWAAGLLAGGCLWLAWQVLY